MKSIAFPLLIIILLTCSSHANDHLQQDDAEEERSTSLILERLSTVVTKAVTKDVAKLFANPEIAKGIRNVVASRDRIRETASFKNLLQSVDDNFGAVARALNKFDGKFKKQGVNIGNPLEWKGGDHLKKINHYCKLFDEAQFVFNYVNTSLSCTADTTVKIKPDLRGATCALLFVDDEKKTGVGKQVTCHESVFNETELRIGPCHIHQGTIYKREGKTVVKDPLQDCLVH